MPLGEQRIALCVTLRLNRKFKTAEVRYVTVADLDAEALLRWFEKAKASHSDHKNVMKNKGLLNRLRVPKPDSKLRL